jgi:hypothetical protein
MAAGKARNNAEIVLARLVTLMRSRKDNNLEPFVLLLGSEVMPLRAIEDSVLTTFAGLDPGELEDLERHEQFPNAWRKFRDTEHQSINHLRGVFYGRPGAEAPGQEGYAGLAWLTHQGYFDVILTTDVSKRLENALTGEGVPVSQYRVHFCPGADANLVANLSRAHPIKIVKLHGDLDERFVFTPEEREPGLQSLAQSVLKCYGSRPVLVVGYENSRDGYLFHSFHPTQAMFCVHTEMNPGWVIYQSILRNQRDAGEYIMRGDEAGFDSFFRALAERLGRPAGKAVPKPEPAAAAAGRRRMDRSRPALQVPGEVSPPPPRPAVDLFEFVDRTIFHIELHADMSVSYSAEGGMICRGGPSPPLQDLDVAALNQQLVDLGDEISRLRQDPNPAAFAEWRTKVMQQGKDFYEKLIRPNAELLKDLHLARRTKKEGENLILCFVGQRRHLGMPCELLADDRPLVVEHPVCRQVVTRPNVSARSFGRLIDELIRKQEPLRVLLVASNAGTDGLAVDEEIALLGRLIREQTRARGIRTEITEFTTASAVFAAVEKELKQCRHHIVHYAGHAEFDARRPEESRLLFRERKRSKSTKALTARALGTWLSSAETQLIFLNACVGAVVRREHRRHQDYMGLMDALVEAGVPSVLGYRWEVSDEGARHFAELFYQALFETHCPARAAFRARKQIYADNADENETWASPILVAQKLDRS